MEKKIDKKTKVEQKGECEWRGKNGICYISFCKKCESYIGDGDLADCKRPGLLQETKPCAAIVQKESAYVGKCEHCGYTEFGIHVGDYYYSGLPLSIIRLRPFSYAHLYHKPYAFMLDEPEVVCMSCGRVVSNYRVVRK